VFSGKAAVLNLKQTLSPRVIQDLKKRSYAGIFIYTIALGVVVFADGFYFRHPIFSKVFLTLMTGICMFRLVLGFMDNWLQARAERLNHYLFLGGVVLTALIWGCGFGRMIVMPDEANTLILMVAATVGICSGGCVAFCPHLWLVLSYNFLLLWPGILWMSFLSIQLPLVSLLLIFFIYMVFISLRGNSEYLTGIENEALLKQKTWDLEKLSNLDGLTGIYNRRYFDTALEVAWQEAIRNQHRLALVLCDIDYFKQVNDDFGHQAGDEYLKSFAHTLNQVFQRQTDIAARYGGEEFVVLIPNASPGTALALAQRFKRQIGATRLFFEGQMIQATVSIGVSELVPDRDQNNTTLVSRADAMLYEAKNKGRNRVEVFAA